MLPDCLPAGIQDRLAFPDEILLPAADFHGGFGIAVIFRSRAEEPDGYQLQDGRFSLGETTDVAPGHGLRRDDGMVVADFAVVKDRRRADRVCPKGIAGIFELPGNRAGQCRQHVPHILRQVSAVRPGISDQFLLIQVLGIIQGLLGRESQDPVGVALQARQIVEERRLFKLFLRFHAFYHGLPLRSALKQEGCGFRLILKPTA